MPEIRVGYTPAGRETLEAITDELVPLPLPAVVERESSSPEIIVREGVIERDTLAAIMAEAGADHDPAATPIVNVPAVPGRGKAAIASPTIAVGPTFQIFEMVTYVVRGVEPAQLASDALRRAFVEEHLLARLPVTSMAEVDRIDVTPWTVPGTLVVRAWCTAKPRH